LIIKRKIADVAGACHVERRVEMWKQITPTGGLPFQCQPERGNVDGYDD
jgi:hypothetical protein